MFHALICVEVRHLKKHLRFTLEMPNCGAVGAVGAVAVFSPGKNCQKSVFPGSGKVKHELRVQIHQLRVQIHELED